MADNQDSGTRGTGQADLPVTQVQACQYMEAVYGENVWDRALETFESPLVQWIWAIARGVPDVAEDAMTRIVILAEKARMR